MGLMNLQTEMKIIDVKLKETKITIFTVIMKTLNLSINSEQLVPLIFVGNY